MITEEEVKKLRESYMKAQDASSVEGCLSYWDDEGALIPPNGTIFQGKEKLRELYENLFSSVRYDVKITFDEIGVSDEWSFAQGSYEGFNHPLEGEKPTPLKGKYLEIHKRQPDGSLKFYRHMWSQETQE